MKSQISLRTYLLFTAKLSLDMRGVANNTGRSHEGLLLALTILEISRKSMEIDYAQTFAQSLFRNRW